MNLDVNMQPTVVKLIIVPLAWCKVLPLELLPSVPVLCCIFRISSMSSKRVEQVHISFVTSHVSPLLGKLPTRLKTCAPIHHNLEAS